jgi:type 1 glutamine amidotransferase
MKFSCSISRRTLVQNAGFLAGAGLLGWGLENPRSQNRDLGHPAPAAGTTTIDQRPISTRALALIGDRYHNADYIRVALDKTFKELAIPVDYTIQYDQISRNLLKRYQLFLCLRDGMIWPNGYLGPDAYIGYERNLENLTPGSLDPQPESWITEEQGGAIRDFVSEGNGFYALHNSSHISLSSKNYREVMGGAYIGHPPLRPFCVRPTANTHPISQGIGEFMVNDEQHYVEYDKDKRYVFLEAENIDGLTYEKLGTKSISGWAYDFGKGRVVFTAVGHTIHAMWAPQYLEIQKRSIRWLLKQI